jgi:heptosyltransferase III
LSAEVRILVVRRDNIGDLVCTTPLLTALRQHFPRAWLGALVNSYNAPILERNADLNEVIAYTKLKHLEEGESSFAALGRRLTSLWRLRRMRLDAVVLATPDFVPRLARLARWLAPKQVVGFSDGSAASRSLDWSIPTAQVDQLHEVERVFSLAAHFGIGGEIPPLGVVPDASEVERARTAFAAGTGPRVGLHISARRPRQRWPTARFAALIERLYAAHGARVMLLWAPGAPADARHPGDDDKAAEIVRRLDGRVPLAAYRTASLPELVGALAACDLVICPDGGAMHIAAGLGRPIVCFFGDSSPERWRPWGVRQRVLRPDSHDVSDLTVDEALIAALELLPRI